MRDFVEKQHFVPYPKRRRESFQLFADTAIGASKHQAELALECLGDHRKRANQSVQSLFRLIRRNIQNELTPLQSCIQLESGIAFRQKQIHVETIMDREGLCRRLPIE